MDVKTIFTNKKVIVAASAVVIGGTTVGYILWKRRKQKFVPVQLSLFDQIAEEAVTNQSVTDFLGKEFQAAVDRVIMENKNEEEVFNVPVEDPPAVTVLDEVPLREIVVTNPKSVIVEHVETETPPEPFRVFKSRPTTWNAEAELSTRTATAPYIIHKDEFLEDEMDFRQQTVTYYVQDDILADEEDTPIYGFKQQMGELKFGHGSDDPNVVYIRNEALRSEWEVLKHAGSFAYEVLGEEFAAAVENELKHSVLKFRRE